MALVFLNGTTNEEQLLSAILLGRSMLIRVEGLHLCE